MPYIATFLWIILFSLSSFGQELKINGAYLSLEKDTIDYGDILINSDGERIINMINTGNEPLLINVCEGSCGCTVPKCPDMEIFPGDSNKIKIIYDTKQLGIFNKTITIKSNAINNTVYIKVIGKVTH